MISDEEKEKTVRMTGKELFFYLEQSEYDTASKKELYEHWKQNKYFTKEKEKWWIN
jgi:hypothetical protein